MPYQGLSVGLCCRKIWYSAAAIARSASVSGSPRCQAHAFSPLLPPRPLYSWATQVMAEMAGKRADCPPNKSLCLLDYWTPPQLKMSIYIGIQVSLSPLPIWKDLSTSFTRSFSRIFHNPALSSAWQSINPLATDHQSVNCTSGHFSFQTKRTTMYTVQTSVRCDNFPSQCLSRLFLKGVVML